MNKNQINRSDEDFELMGDMPKEDPVIAEVKTFFINNISKKNHFSVVFYGKMKSRKNLENIYLKVIVC
jgi:hypothetical protein